MAEPLRKYEIHEHVKAAKKYAREVISGKIPASELTKLSCRRFINDLAHRRGSEKFDFVFNKDRAERACRAAELFKHYKGIWAGACLVLEPWECFIFCNLFGWETRSPKAGGDPLARDDHNRKKQAGGQKTHKRRFRRAFIFVPRKNGKTMLAAIIGLIMLTVEAEPGAEVYCGATSEDQADEVFRPAKAMAEQADGFKEHFGIQIMKSSIFRESGLSFFKKLIGKPGEGQSPYCHICDEYHEHPTADQVNTMYTGMKARQEPLQLIITTAGVDISCPCKELDDHTRKVLNGTRQDERLFILHYTIDKDDKWEDFEVWRKANPNLGVSISEEDLRATLAEAVQRVGEQNTVRTKHLNEWMSAGTAWMNITAWNRQAKPELKLEDFKGKPCFAALDLASKIDVLARTLLFKDGDNYYGFGRYYLPSETIKLPENDHYRRWVAESWMTETEGARTDLHRVEEDLKADNAIYPIRALAFDPREASYLIENVSQWLGEDRCIEVPQAPVHISEPMKELEAMIYAGKFWFNGDPVMSWMMGNVMKKEGRGGGPIKAYYPTKNNAASKIDAIVCLIMCIKLAMTLDLEETSVYDKRGILWV
jgi:phage terminase large subunit-like protein